MKILLAEDEVSMARAIARILEKSNYYADTVYNGIDAGHEIKTPLAIINADVDVLEMDLGENEWLEDIHKQAKCLVGLTNALVYLSRMEEEEKDMQCMIPPMISQRSLRITKSD